MKLSNTILTLALGTATLTSLLAIAGCSSTKTAQVVPAPGTTAGLPTPTTPTPVNTYTGVRGPGLWSLTLNNTSNTFSYQPITFPYSPNTPVTGSLVHSNGFSKFNTGGYALEVEGRAVAFRPGDTTAPLVFAVPQTSCYAIVGRVRFQYIDMTAEPSQSSTSGTGPTLGYGSVAASTNTSGSSWQFADAIGNIAYGPQAFDGACATSNSLAQINFTGSATILDDNWNPGANVDGFPANTQSNIAIGPSGFFVTDQSDPTQTVFPGASIAGIIEPSTAITTSDMSSKNYLGFFHLGAVNSGVAVSTSTSPLWMTALGNSSGLIGGVYPSDDVTQTPSRNIQLNFGSQDSIYNGLYTKASITVLDPAQNCANLVSSGNHSTSGVNADGYVTCTFPAIVIVGNEENKYAIFVQSYNWASTLGGQPMQIYLFQQ